MDTRTTVIAGAGVAVAATAAVVAASGALGPNAASLASPTPQEAARLLTQATFGVTDDDIAAVQSAGMEGWIDQQMAMQPFSTLDFMNQRNDDETLRVEPHGNFVRSFWIGAINRPDQLRQRMQFALSQIFVVSRENETLEFDGAFGTGNYYDLLANNAFGNFRTLLEQVTLNAMMGIFLSFVKNDKEDPATGRTPDENYAREVMQLFTIGTVMLNPDGSPQRDRSGNTIPTYTHDDIAGLAKVFTGISWFSPTPDDGTFLSASNPYIKPMIFYPTHHSTSRKVFLGVVIPASTTPNPAGDLKVALDTLFNHPNVGPFIARRLIQQFVTSNPTPAYIARVAARFDNNGQGVRGDLGAVLKAILLDNEARDTAAAQANPNFGKLREPMIRMTNWGRTFHARSINGFYEIGETGAPTFLAQGILDAPSVFNFWRSTYVPPHTRIGDQGLVAPEFQVLSELTAASYINVMRFTVDQGIGADITDFSGTDVVSDYTAEVALAATPEALLDRLNLLLFYGQMSAGLRQQILAAVNAVNIPASPDSAIQAARLNRAKLAIFLSMVSGEYLTQR
ncbi:MAG TPA: DUF1800 family protein [Phenylobacterium sp.]|nr:DUF1800 family protein [Phenylobacterium sp.]